MGTLPEYPFRAASFAVPEGSSLYVFSDGVFELVRPIGGETGLGDFVPLLMCPPTPPTSECHRLLKAAVEMGGKESFDDDFTILVAEFD